MNPTIFYLDEEDQTKVKDFSKKMFFTHIKKQCRD